MLHDAHNHLQDEWLAPHLDRIARTATDLGIADMVVNGTHPDDWPRVAELATRFPFVRPAYGIHPWDAGRPRPDDWLAQLEARLLADPRASVGEIGLDRWILDSARPDDPRLAGVRRASLDEQTAVFLPQLALAAKHNRPVTIHCLQAFGALDELLHSHEVPARGFLLHAYSGPAELVPRLAACGAYFSFNGYFLDPRKTRQQDVFKLIAADRLLVETDAPAMPLPQSWRTHKLPPAPDGSSVNHPGNLDAAYAGLASLRGLPLTELIAQVDTNFRRFFGC
ncbi:MAG: TatD family hydrolase [Opitutaceae bacterium]|jgi:TatD DNase family protein